jgi:excisionase family DNA binding protein
MNGKLAALRQVVRAMCLSHLPAPPAVAAPRILGLVKKEYSGLLLGAFPPGAAEVERKVERFVRGSYLAFYRSRCAKPGAAAQEEPPAEYVTTQEAADYLGVSRPYVVQLIETGILPAHKVGPYRRLPRHAVVEFHKRRLKEALAKADALTDVAKKLKSRKAGSRNGAPV